MSLLLEVLKMWPSSSKTQLLSLGFQNAHNKYIFFFFLWISENTLRKTAALLQDPWNLRWVWTIVFLKDCYFKDSLFSSDIILFDFFLKYILEEYMTVIIFSCLAQTANTERPWLLLSPFQMEAIHTTILNKKQWLLVPLGNIFYQALSNWNENELIQEAV